MEYVENTPTEPGKSPQPKARRTDTPTPVVEETDNEEQVVTKTDAAVSDNKPPVPLSREEKIEQLLEVLTYGVREVLKVEQSQEKLRQDIIVETLESVNSALTAMIDCLTVTVGKIQVSLDFMRDSLGKLNSDDKPYTDELLPKKQ